MNLMPAVAPECCRCFKAASGRFECSNCHSAFYCSKECQSEDWERGGHKHACPLMKEKFESDAKHLVLAMKGITQTPLKNLREAFDELDFETLEMDGAVAYQAANLTDGFNNAVRLLLHDDSRNIMKRLREGVEISYTAWILHRFWMRRSRNERGLVETDMQSIAATRIKSYVFSHLNALNTWVDAVFAVCRASVSTKKCFDLAEAALSTLTLSFFSNTASRAILLGKSKQANDDAVARVETLCMKIKEGVEACHVPEDDDAAETCRSICFLAATMSCRVKELEIEGVDFDNAIGLRGWMKEFYAQQSLPLAIRSIKNGSFVASTDSDE